MIRIPKSQAINMAKLFDQGSFDGTLMFENLMTHKMPPENKSQQANKLKTKLDSVLKAHNAVIPDAVPARSESKVRKKKN